MCSDLYARRRSLGIFCFTPYSFGAEDKASYLPSWRKHGRNTSNRINQSPWVYHSAGETGTSSVRGRHQTFSGGGYLIPVWSSRNSKMVESLEKLRKALWVDNNTRAVVLEFTVFNPTYNVFASVQLWFEFTNIGLIDSSYHDIAIYQVHSLVNIRDLYRMFFQAAYLIVMIIYSIKMALHVWDMRHSLWQYFATIWTLTELPIIILSYACVPMIVWQYVVANNISVEIQNSRGKKFISISQLLTCDNAILSIVCIVHFMLMMHILRLSIFLGKRNILFAFNVFRARQYIPCIAFLFAVLFITTILTLRSLFGSYCVGLENFARAVIYTASLFRLSVSSKNECTHDFSSFVNLMLFSFAAFCVAFMLRLLVLMCGITAQFTPTTWDEKAELQFVDFLKCRVLIGIGYWNMDDYTAHTISQQARPEIPRTRDQRRLSKGNLLYRRFHPLRAQPRRKFTSVATQTMQHVHPGTLYHTISGNSNAFTPGHVAGKYQTGTSRRKHSRPFSQI